MGTIEEVVKWAPHFHKLIPYSHLVVTNREEYVFSIPGEQFFINAFDAGHAFRDGSIGKETVETGQVVNRVGNPAVSGGIPYQGMGVPLAEGDEIVGSMCIFLSTQNRDVLQSTSETMAAMVEELSATTDNLSQNATELSSLVEELSSDSRVIAESSHLIGEMANVIDEVSARTRIIGLNAGIEAARAGDAGRTFKVIASEVRKLSEQTAVSSREVVDATSAVVSALKEINEKIEEIFSRIRGQAEDTGELASAIEQIVHVGADLNSLAQRIRS